MVSSSIIQFLGVLLVSLVAVSLLRNVDAAGTTTKSPSTPKAFTAGDDDNLAESCIGLGVKAEETVEKIAGRKLLFADTNQRQLLMETCLIYSKMRAKNGCIPEQTDTIYDYACDTLLGLAVDPRYADCWNRSHSCVTNSSDIAAEVSQAYCRFLYSAQSQLECAEQLTPQCHLPNVTILQQAAEKIQHYQTTYLCSSYAEAVLSKMAAEHSSTTTAAAAKTTAKTTAAAAKGQKVTPALEPDENVVHVTRAPDDQQLPVYEFDSNGEPCPSSEIEKFVACYASISEYTLHPITVLRSPELLDNACKANGRFRTCMRNVTCWPPVGSGYRNMLGFLCRTGTVKTFKQHLPCMQQVAESDDGRTCDEQFSGFNLAALSSEDSCRLFHDSIQCSYNQLVNECSVETADFQLHLMQSFVKVMNLSCDVEPPPFSNDTVIGIPMNCSVQEQTAMEVCLQPFETVTDKLTTVISGGLQSLLKGMRKISEIFREGCDVRPEFDDCMLKAVQPNSHCRLSSCLIKIGDYACNFTGESDMTLEDRLRCLFSLIGEPEFSTCMKVFPKEAFKQMKVLQRSLPRFTKCMERPVLDKCGQTTLDLIKSLGSQATASPEDRSCVIKLKGIDDDDTGSTMAATKQSAKTTTATTTVGPKGTSGPKVAEVKTAEVKTALAQCNTSKEGEKLGSCYTMLKSDNYDGNDYFPYPLKIFNDADDLDTFCVNYKNFTSCIDSLSCQASLALASKEVLLRVCTVQYSNYKSSGTCIVDVANSITGGECTAPMYRLLNSPLAEQQKSMCETVNAMVACVKSSFDDKCPNEALDLTYDLYTSFALQFDSQCQVKPPVLLVTGTECTNDEMNAYEQCNQHLFANHTLLRPVTLLGNAGEFDTVCRSFNDSYRPCLIDLNCSPSAYADAYVIAVDRMCQSTELRANYQKNGDCVANALNTATARDCTFAYSDMEWYGGSDPKATTEKVCKTIDSALQCLEPEVRQHCGRDASRILYETNQNFLKVYQPECQLTTPITDSANSTAATEPSVKTTPSKQKDAQQAGQAGGAPTILYSFLTIALGLVISVFRII